MTIYAVTLRATTDDRASVHALRAVLKFAKRRGLRAIDVRELPSTNKHITIRRRSGGQRVVDHKTQRRESTIMTISLKKYGPTNKWLKLEDLHGKPPMRERIGLVKVEDGKFGERVVLVFEPSGQMLSLNKTSVGNLLRDFGENDEDWLGKLVEVYAGEVPGKGGDPMDAVLVRAVTDVPADAAIAAKAVKAAKAKKASDDMYDTIPFS